MPASIHRTTAGIHSSNCIVPLSYHPINPSPPWFSSWMLKGSIPTSILNSDRSYFAEHLDNQSDPSGPSILMVYYATLDASMFWTPQSLTTCSPVLAWPSPCRSFQSDETLHQVCMQYYWSGLPVYIKTTENCAPLVPCQTCAPQTLQTSQATSNSREALEFHIHGFIEKLPPSSGYTSILVIVDCLSKQSLFILHIFSKHVS